ncbi:hypothetical protein DFH11DRAFT_1505944, partial [Phellopilus nigrolimitatus]
VRGTPASGKTSLANLLCKYIEEIEDKPKLSYISTWSEKDLQKYGDYFGWLAKHGWTPQSTLIVDEAQDTYWDTKFWNDFLKGIDKRSRYRVILFASYGSPISTGVVGTPMIISAPCRITLRPIDHGDGLAPVGLLFSEEELSDYIALHFGQHKFDPSFLQDVMRITAGHVGAAESILETVTTRSSAFKTSSNRFTSAMFLTSVSPNTLMQGLENASIFGRGVPRPEELGWKPLTDVFKTVVDENRVTEDMFKDNAEKMDALQLAFRKGCGFRFKFKGEVASSPLDQSLPQFALAVIKQFSARGLSASVQCPLGTRLREEFYRSCFSYTKTMLATLPELGMPEGCIDFFVLTKKWGIKLLQNGDRCANHSDGLSSGESAEWITPGMMDDHITLDFCTTLPKTKHTGDQSSTNVFKFTVNLLIQGSRGYTTSSSETNTPRSVFWITL